MAKSQLFGVHPVLDFIYKHGGVFPVLRGQARRGGLQDRAHGAEPGRDRADVRRRAAGRAPRSLGSPSQGVGRLALESGVPVVPVAIHGSQDVREFRRLRFPKVTVQYGEPIAFQPVENPTREQSQETSEQIFNRVREDVRGAGPRGPQGRPRAPPPRAPARASARADACSRYAFLRTCQSTVISATVGAALVGELDLDREYDLAVRVEALQQRLPSPRRVMPVAVIGPFASFR